MKHFCGSEQGCKKSLPRVTPVHGSNRLQEGEENPKRNKIIIMFFQKVIPLNGKLNPNAHVTLQIGQGKCSDMGNLQ